MTALCKRPFRFELFNLYLAGFTSLFIHLVLFYQGASLLSSSSSERLLGKRGGPENATEVSFFPHLGRRLSPTPLSHQSPLNLPTQTKTASKSSQSSSDEPSKGIGQGGTSTEYASLLHAYLDSAKVFPRSLKDLGLSGIVKVRFQVTPEGRLADIRLAESKAPQLLQQEAVRFLQRLDKVPLPPSHLTSQQLHFELPLRYELKS
ncbi:MAG: energy transducer TonB [Pseudomonadota bacterium]